MNNDRAQMIDLMQMSDFEEEHFQKFYSAMVDSFEEALNEVERPQVLTTMAAVVYAAGDILKSHPPVVREEDDPQGARNFKVAALTTMAAYLDLVDCMKPELAEQMRKQMDEKGGLLG